MAETYDAIVVGARVAGSATATLLARQGARVLLVDRVTMPAPTVSCPIFYGNSLAMLARLGVLEQVQALGAPRIRYYGTRVPAAEMLIRLPESHGFDYAYSLRREKLDSTLLEHARAQPGVRVREGFSVRSLVWGDGRVVGVRGAQGHGPSETIYAHAVIGADGKRSSVAREAGAQIYEQIDARTCIFYAYYRNFAGPGFPCAMIYGDPVSETGALTFDADEGLSVLSVGIPVAQFGQARKDPEAAIEAVVRMFPELARRRVGAERATPVMGQPPIASYYRESYGPGWALVGDAGHYIDPITGQGINYALRGAELFAEAWARTQRRAAWRQAMAAYQRQRDEYTRPIWEIIKLGERLRDTAAPGGLDLSEPLLRAIARQPDVASRYIGIYSGATPAGQFMSPLNIMRIIASDFVRNEAAALGGRMLRRAFGAA